MADLMKMSLISCYFHKEHHFDIYRDKQNRYFIRVDGKITQKRLKANEVIGYLVNSLQNQS